MASPYIKKMELEILKVTPPPGSPTDISLPLTFLDLFCFKIPPIEKLFFYEASYSELLFSASIIPKLKHSLSATFRHYLPLAGNLVWPSSSPNPVIHYKEGDGVLLTVAQSDADFHHLSGVRIREYRIFRPLVARIAGSDSQVPVIALKITRFPNKGFCIGITVHHGVFDAKSLELFMKTWALISKLGELKKGLGSELIPVFDRKPIRERSVNIENLCIKFLKQNGVTPNSFAVKEFVSPPDRVLVTVDMSRLEVRKLKELVRDQIPNYVSTFTVTFAYVILCIVKAKALKKSNMVITGFGADIRGRLEPPLPANYFGNCLSSSGAIIFDREKLLGHDGLALIVKSISKSIKSLNSGVLKEVEQLLSNMFERMDVNDTETTRIRAAGSRTLEFQRIDFGWGRPKKVDFVSVRPHHRITFTEVGDGGVEIDLSLNMDEVKSFSHEFAQGLEKLMKNNSAAL